MLYQQLKKLRAKGPRIALNVSASTAASPEQATSSAPRAKSDLNYRDNVQRLLVSRLDRITALERELLQIVLVLPDSLTLMQQRQLIEQVRQPLLREMLQLCGRLQQQNQLLHAESVLNHVENAELKRLILGLVSQAEEQTLTEKLQQTTFFPDGSLCPLHLRQVIEQLEWEYKESHHRSTTQQSELKKNEPAMVDDRLRKLLQDAAQFHQQRVTRKTASN